jgi:hypothetical protein
MALELDSKRGVFNHYGVRTTEKKYGADTDDDKVKWVEWVFNYNDLPASGTSNLQYSIPANARILSARLEIITAFTSTSTTTDLTIGLSDSAGNVISADGLILATEATQTTIATVGNVIVGSTGGLINKTIGTTAGELVVAASAADLLTGRARLLVEYIRAGV